MQNTHCPIISSTGALPSTPPTTLKTPMAIHCKAYKTTLSAPLGPPALQEGQRLGNPLLSIASPWHQRHLTLSPLLRLIWKTHIPGLGGEIDILELLATVHAPCTPPLLLTLPPLLEPFVSPAVTGSLWQVEVQTCPCSIIWASFKCVSHQPSVTSCHLSEGDRHPILLLLALPPTPNTSPYPWPTRP